jgi:hypothetical protein
METLSLVKALSNDFSQVISRDECAKHPPLNWGNNGIGNRWCSGMFCYTAVYHNRHKTYNDVSNRVDDVIDQLNEFRSSFFSDHKRKQGIIGIFVHYTLKDEDKTKRPIRNDIAKKIKAQSCVHCGSTQALVCDHKNDFYNDTRVLKSKTQTIDDFQCLCTHCNLLKRQVCKDEKTKHKLHSAKLIPIFCVYYYEFPWEKKAYDLDDPNNKRDTYWYDPVEFSRKLHMYQTYTRPIIAEIKRKVIQGTLTKS